MSVNKAIIQGRLGKDPEIRDTANGKVANLSVATSKFWKDKEGERKEKTEWHRVTVWNQNTIKFIEKHFNKGDQVYIEGELETRKYEKDGVDHYTTGIVVGNFGGDAQKIWTSGGDQADDRSSRSRSRDDDNDDRGSSRGRSSSRSRDDDDDDRGSRSRGGDDPKRRAAAKAEMDDEIPF